MINEEKNKARSGRKGIGEGEFLFPVIKKGFYLISNKIKKEGLSNKQYLTTIRREKSPVISSDYWRTKVSGRRKNM